MAGKFELKKSSNDQFFFNLKAGNGEIILTSQMYAAKSGAEDGIESARKNAPLDARYARKTSTGGQPYFALTAANSEAIGKSETYSSTSAMENGIESVKKNAPDAKVDDLT
jgi:uncharacterized protein YegP (UPF0339 family)